MADPVSVVAIAASLFTFSSSSLLLVQNLVKSQETLQRVEQEVVVLQYILEECVNVVSAHTDMKTLPKSLVTVLSLCHERHITLLKTLERIFTKKSRIARALHLSFRDEELMSSYRAFRESALLLRDLCSDLRMSRQLLEVSAEIAQLLLDQDESSSGDEELYPGDKHDGASVASERGGKSKSTGAEGGDRDGSASIKAGHPGSKKRNTRRRLEKFNRDVGELLASDFTRDLIVIFETDSEEPSNRFKRVLLRNKIDTYSDENFISHKVIDRYAHLIKKDDTGGTGVITVIPEAQRKERELTMLGGYKLVPEREIRLEWYRPKDAQKRETTFIIGDHDPPFDTLISKAEWEIETPKAAFPIFGKRKSKKHRKEQKKEDKEAEEGQEKAARDLIRKQLEEVSRLGDGKGKGKGPSGGSTGAPPPPPVPAH